MHNFFKLCVTIDNFPCHTPELKSVKPHYFIDESMSARFRSQDKFLSELRFIVIQRTECVIRVGTIHS